MVFEKIRKADREEYLAMEHDFYHSPAVLHPIPDENHKLTFDVLMEGSPYTVCFMFRSDDKKEVYGFALLALTYSNEAGGYMSTGQLEMSNVDLSSEFTEMITTQRGFQANSRIITVSDTLLEELTNLKR